MSLKKVIAAIKRNKNFLITTHTNLEGDALGSELALFKMLKEMGKVANIVNEDNLPYGFDFLPQINKIKKLKKNIKIIKFDCLVVLDCSSLSRCGKILNNIDLSNKVIINIDHHISNQRFGNVNWVEPFTSSACEMIYKLYKKLAIPFDKEVALFLYVGILSDTGSFRYSNTTSLTHKVVSELLKYNLDIVQIYKSVYENIPFSDMHLLAKILPTIKRYAFGKIAWFEIKQNILRKQRILFDLTEHLLSFARAIKGVEVAVLFKENLRKGFEVGVNLRSQGKVDVNKVASFFGGGGHRTASGCTIKGRIELARRKVLNKIKEMLDECFYRSEANKKV